MSMYIVDDEQRRDRPQHPCALRVPAARGHLRLVLALLDDVHRHRLRRAAWHLPPWRSERGPSQFSDGLLSARPRAPQTYSTVRRGARRSATQ